LPALLLSLLPLFPYTTLFRSRGGVCDRLSVLDAANAQGAPGHAFVGPLLARLTRLFGFAGRAVAGGAAALAGAAMLSRPALPAGDRKSTRLNSRHTCNSYTVF